ncbi:hypothetical protein D9M69_535000 [compost metagenome]
MVQRERERGADAQRAGWVERGGVHRGLGVAQVGQDAAGALKELLTRVGEVEAARVALKQAHAQALFQRGQLAAGAGVGHVHQLRRTAQAAALGHVHKQLHLGPAIHVHPVFAARGKVICSAALDDIVLSFYSAGIQRKPRRKNQQEELEGDQPCATSTNTTSRKR